MNKNTKILVVVIIVILIIIGLLIINRKKELKKTTNETIITSSETEENNQLQIILEESGLDVQIGENVYSELLGEEGNVYNVDGIEFEVYNVNETKINQLTQGNQGEIIIQGENNRKEEGLVFGEIVILKCIDIDMKENLIKILSEQNEKNTDIIPINSVDDTAV